MRHSLYLFYEENYRALKYASANTNFNNVCTRVCLSRFIGEHVKINVFQQTRLNSNENASVHVHVQYTSAIETTNEYNIVLYFVYCFRTITR